MDRTENNDYKSALFSFLAATALLAAMILLPGALAGLLQPLVVFGIPVFLVYAVAKSGYAAGGAAAVLCYVVGALLNYKLAALLAAACLPFALGTGYAIRKKKRFRHAVMISVAAALCGALLAVGVLWLLTGQMPVDAYISRFGAGLSAMDDASIHIWYQLARAEDLMSGAVTQAALDSTPSAAAAAYIVNILKEWLNLRLVSIIGVYALLMGLLGYLIPRAALKKQKTEVAPAPAFSDYALPNRFWLAFVLSWLAAFAGFSLGWKGFDILRTTVFTLYAVVLMIQGLSFLDYLFKRRKMKKGVRVVLHILVVLISPSLGNLLMWVGLFENIAQMRKRLESKGGAAN